MDSPSEAEMGAAMFEHAEGPDGTLTINTPKATIVVEKSEGRIKMSEMKSGKKMLETSLDEYKESLYKNALRDCQSNLKSLATSLEMCGTENAGAYPSSLAAVVPSKLKVMPKCPVTGKDTYSANYQGTASAYTLMCAGGNHKPSGLPENFPQYSAALGLINKPGDVASPAATAPSKSPSADADNEE